MSHPRILTHTRRYLNPLDIGIHDVDIHDIAHHLAQINRFAGAIDFPISVAIHSVYVSHLVEERLREDIQTLTRLSYQAALQGLLHDGSEAYLGDVTKWLKATAAMEGYRDAEERAQATIFRAFNLSEHQAPVVDWADRVMVRWEGTLGFGPAWRVVGPDNGDHPLYPSLTPEEIALVDSVAKHVALNTPWEMARSAFLRRFDSLLWSIDNA